MFAKLTADFWASIPGDDTVRLVVYQKGLATNNQAIIIPSGEGLKEFDQRLGLTARSRRLVFTENTLQRIRNELEDEIGYEAIAQWLILIDVRYNPTRDPLPWLAAGKRMAAAMVVAGQYLAVEQLDKFMRRAILGQPAKHTVQFYPATVWLLKPVYQ